MGKKTIARVEIEGIIEAKNETYSQKWILDTIKELEDDKKVAALVLHVNSPGGGVYQSAEVFRAARRFSEKTKKPVWAFFASLAASGGYYIGCAADKIVADPNTLTGSIGVIAGRFIDLTGLMEKHGVKEELIHAGRNKIMGHFSAPATDEQRAIMQSVADECYDDFVRLVAERRGMDEEHVRELADGRIYTARQAKAAGLVDEISPFDDAMDRLKEEIGDKKAEVKRFAPKKRRSLKALLNGIAGFGSPSAAANPLAAAAGLLEPPTPFPAYYCPLGKLR